MSSPLTATATPTEPGTRRQGATSAPSRGRAALGFAVFAAMAVERSLSSRDSSGSLREESSLIAAAARGDEPAFERLMGVHRELMRAVCHRICANPHTADDAFQLALIAAWRGLPQFDGRSRLATWLYRIAYNASVGVLRTQSRHRGESIDVEHAFEGSGWSDPARSVVEGDAIRRALALVPLDFRSAVVLRDLVGCSYREVAEIQGVRLETAKTRIARGRRALASLLASAASDPGDGR